MESPLASWADRVGMERGVGDSRGQTLSGMAQHPPSAQVLPPAGKSPHSTCVRYRRPGVHPTVLPSGQTRPGGTTTQVHVPKGKPG